MKFINLIYKLNKIVFKKNKFKKNVHKKYLIIKIKYWKSRRRKEKLRKFKLISIRINLIRNITKFRKLTLLNLKIGNWKIRSNFRVIKQLRKLKPISKKRRC